MPRYVITHTINDFDDDGIVPSTTATSASTAVIEFWEAAHPGSTYDVELHETNDWAKICDEDECVSAMVIPAPEIQVALY